MSGDGGRLAVRCLLSAGWWTAGKQTAPCHLQPEKPLLPERSDAQNSASFPPLEHNLPAPAGHNLRLRSGRRLPSEPSKPYEFLIFPATMPAPIRKMPAHWMGVMDSPSTSRAMTRATGSSDAASTEPRPGPTWGMPRPEEKAAGLRRKYQGGSHRGGEGARRKNQGERPAEGEGRSAGYHRWT